MGDQQQLTDAVIDLTGVDEAPVWQWLTSLYPPFNGKVPGNDAAQEFLAARLTEHLGAALGGEAIVARMQTDLERHRSVVAFQPATLPRIAAISFSGQHELTADALAGVLRKITADNGYTDRQFHEVVDQNLRQVYENHGMYRVRFPSIAWKKAAAGSDDVTITIEEGPKYTLGDVEFDGENLPLDAIRKDVKFKKGQLANWSEIQQGIWQSERPVKRTGYFSAASRAVRVFHDDQLTLDVHVTFVPGPLYRYGELLVSGLDPEQEARVRTFWKALPGDPYDFIYPNEVLSEYVRSVDASRFKKVSAVTRNLADHRVEITLSFEPAPPK